MKDKELNLEEIEDSHTLGGSGEGGVQGRGKWRGCTCYSVVRYTIASNGRTGTGTTRRDLGVGCVINQRT
jgi:hypothetical protein